MSIKNFIEGASAVGTVPTGGALTATLPNAYSANSHPLQAAALVRLSSGLTSLVQYVPMPQGSILLDIFLDPIQAPATAFNIQVGNESGGDADFGTLAVLNTGNVRVLATGPVVGAAYAGVRGNSVKLTFSALPSLAEAERSGAKRDKHEAGQRHADEQRHAEQREPEQREHLEHNDKKNKRKDAEQAAREEAEQKNDPQAYELARKAQAKTQQKETGAAPEPVPDYPTREEPGLIQKPNGAGVAPLAGVPEFSLLATAMNATTDTAVALTTGQPTVTIGSILQIGSEQMQVVSVSDFQHFVVLRGVNSTPKAGHAQNFPVYVNAVAGEGLFYGFLVIRYLMT